MFPLLFLSPFLHLITLTRHSSPITQRLQQRRCCPSECEHLCVVWTPWSYKQKKSYTLRRKKKGWGLRGFTQSQSCTRERVEVIPTDIHTSFYQAELIWTPINQSEIHIFINRKHSTCSLITVVFDVLFRRKRRRSNWRSTCWRVIPTIEISLRIMELLLREVLQDRTTNSGFVNYYIQRLPTLLILRIMIILYICYIIMYYILIIFHLIMYYFIYALVGLLWNCQISFLYSVYCFKIIVPIYLYI